MKYWPSGAQMTLLKLLDGKSNSTICSVFSLPHLKMCNRGLCPCSSAVMTANRSPLVSQKKPFTISLISTTSTGVLRSRMRMMSRFVAIRFFVLLNWVTFKHKKSPSDCQIISASHCIRERTKSSFREGISMSVSRAGLFSRSSVHAAMTLSFGDHWNVFNASSFIAVRLPDSFGMISQASVSRTVMCESLHSARYLASGLHKKCGKSSPSGVTCGVRHLRTHSPVKTR
mmetsp:Transcript_64818/g.198221  ORF Transcript_64818/g.198221 Transcript_64818/m.198221 type:complete len:229 (+) Transcript_64818:669-1355(+)